MEAAGTVDATTQPVVLFGPDTAQFGAVAGAYPAGWKDQLAGKALHAVLEGCEPSSGLRYGASQVEKLYFCHSDHTLLLFLSL